MRQMQRRKLKPSAIYKTVPAQVQPQPIAETQNINHSSQNITGYVADIAESIFDGSPYPGGFGQTKNYDYVDYWTLRTRSMQLFTENPFAKGMIRRLITNEIHTGLKPEVLPIPKYTGMTDDEAQEWGDDREIEFKLWSDNPQICDLKKKQTFGKIQADCRRTALLSGDCLVTLTINKKTGLPLVGLIDGRHIQTFINATPRKGNTIVHGVEIDSKGRHVAFWVRDETDPIKAKRIPAYGEKTGRKIAWLVYGSENKLDDVRGEPILSSILYMLKDLDRGRNAELRAFVVNAMIPMFIKNGDGEIPTHVMDNGARRKGTVDETGSVGTGAVESQGRKWNFSEMMPGTVPQHLAKGEEPVSFNTQRPNANYSKFEEVIINACSWSLELPPEITRLLFQSNFSASRQANNELDIYLQKRNKENGDSICHPVYVEYLIQSALMRTISAQGLLDSWRDPMRWKEFGAWTYAVWVGISRPSVDILKEINAAEKGINAGIGDYDFWNRRITGQSFWDIVKNQKRQREYARKNDLIFAADENQNREKSDTIPGSQQQEIDDLQMRLDEMQEIIETLEVAKNV